MNDLANQNTNNTPLYRLGGGNPASIPDVEIQFKHALNKIAIDSTLFSQSCNTYTSAQGQAQLLEDLAQFFQEHCGFTVTADNIALTNGSQNAFFMLFNMLAGKTDSEHRRIMLPMAPEYIGYEDVAIGEPIFTSRQPNIEILDDQLFKYRLEVPQEGLDHDIAALCVSRPTNPTGNVMSDVELASLDKLALQHRIPLIIDSAYGAPFPNIVHTDVTLSWHENIILSMSLSKLGLPAVRLGIVVAHPDVIDTLTQMNAVMNLCPGGLGAGIMQTLLKDSLIVQLCEQHIRPFYRERAQQALGWFHEAFSGLPVYAHKPEGAIFLWLWFPELNISTAELYQQLKQQGVIIVPGHYFFPGLDDTWEHKQQCIRVNIAGEPEAIRRGFKIIANTVRNAQ